MGTKSYSDPSILLGGGAYRRLWVKNWLGVGPNAQHCWALLYTARPILYVMCFWYVRL